MRQCCPALQFLHPFFQMILHLQRADDQSGDNRDQQPHGQIQPGDLPAEHAEQQDQCDLIDHRRGDQEGKGHPERYTCRKKADEQRYGRVGTEGRHDPRCRGQHVANAEPLAGQQGTRPFGNEKRLHDSDHENDGDQQ